MATGSGELPPLFPVPGLRVGTVAAGIRYPDRLDLVLFELSAGSRCAAVFTRNAFCAAPVQLARQYINAASPRYLLINTGNANAGTGEPGLAAAQYCCEQAAILCGVSANQVLPFSTGVIAEPLPADKIVNGLPAVFAALQQDAWQMAAKGIMTTDTRPKGSSLRYSGPEGSFTVTGIAKGAGMIRPDMATMLSFIATDLAIGDALLQQALRRAVACSFNRITIDGDMSTNDACVLVATGAAGNAEPASSEDPLYQAFCEQLCILAQNLAQAIVRDGEGATRFVEIRVSGGASEAECLRVAYAVAHSPLVKTALFAGDPNWGRILAAVGYAGVTDLDVAGVGLSVNGVLLAVGGAVAEGYSEPAAQAAMANEDICLAVSLGRGESEAIVWTTDLSHDYVSINADYRS